MRRLYLLIAIMTCGCGVHPGKNPDPVDIEGRVTLAGKAVTGVILNLHVTGDGTPASLPVRNGAVKGKVTPGQYTYFLSEATQKSAFQAVPSKYREGSLERQIEIKGTGPVEFAFEK